MIHDLKEDHTLPKTPRKNKVQLGKVRHKYFTEQKTKKKKKPTKQS